MLKESNFNDRVKKLEQLKYSAVLIGLIQKMLCISMKDRLSVSELEQYLFRLVEDN
jgi:hydroxypyruvate isomerase